MALAPELLLIAAIAAVGVLHTMVPDHWVPITLIARQEGWSKAATARAALGAGTGHVLSTLAIGLFVWIAGVAFAARFGQLVSSVSSLALIAFGGWIAFASWRELHAPPGAGHGHSHGHGHKHGDFPHEAFGFHGSDTKKIESAFGEVELSIFELGAPPRFRLTGPAIAMVQAETLRADGTRQVFEFVNLGPYWESYSAIPEPHEFALEVALTNEGRTHTYTTRFVEHEHPVASVSAGRHVHLHRHGSGPAHAHLHEHDSETWHPVSAAVEADPPLHDHGHKRSARTALLFILGSSPMVEGLPAFFAAGKYGAGLIAVMAVVFAASTIATYVVLSVYSAAGLQRLRLGKLEEYGEVLSGAFIALVGVVFLIWPLAV